jgi:hypothetical protein
MPTSTSSDAVAQPMRIQARKGSPAEQLYYYSSSLPGNRWPMPKEIAPGIDPAPLEDLIFHGGRVVPQMEFQNVYLGQTADWSQADIESIDRAITLAMQDKHLNNVMQQYFPSASLACDPRESFVLGQTKPSQIDEPGVQKTVVSLFNEGKIKKSDLAHTIFNLVLPPGTVLTLDDSSSLEGLGGYHGSVHIQRDGGDITLYYSANVFSQIQPGMGENGIVAFDQPWKNVVATLYHEINEFRTDADVRDAIQTENNDRLGWMSRSGRECGDQPIVAASSLNLIFQEVAITNSGKRVPVQFLYSNAVHGAEGPIDSPHADL